MQARILLIEDEASVRECLAYALAHAGYEVLEAADGKEGITLYHKAPADLIITDLIMPEQDGLEVIMEVRRNFPEAKIIAISGGGRLRNTGYLKTAKKLGATSTLIKPFAIDELLQVVQENLRAG